MEKKKNLIAGAAFALLLFFGSFYQEGVGNYSTIGGKNGKFDNGGKNREKSDEGSKNLVKFDEGGKTRAKFGEGSNNLSEGVKNKDLLLNFENGSKG